MKDNVNEKIQKAYIDTVINEGKKKFDLGAGTMGNGMVVWNRAKEVHGDYEKVAHIDQNRKIKYYIKKVPKEVKDYVEEIAKGKNPSASTSQPHMKVFKEMTVEELKDARNRLTEMIDDLKKEE